jgi:hypothetical protein
MENQRRLPSVARKISDIKSEDRRVAVIGTVIGNEGNTIVLDDGTGKLNARFEEPVAMELNKPARVFGRVMPTENGFDLQGEVAQDMSALDMELLKKVEELK